MMSPHAPILSHYQSIAAITAGMLEAARSADWTTVLSLGQQYIDIVEELREMDVSIPMDAATRALKHDLLIRILENDARTRDLASPQMARLSTLLGRIKKHHDHASTFGFKAPT